MTRPLRSMARRRSIAVLAIGATALSGGALLGPGTSSASSHREAPYVASDPAIDNTDVYAFTSPDSPSTATLIANWAPFSEPAGGPNFFPWATDAQYNINIDNNGDAKPDITYRWTFKDVDVRGTTSHGDKVPGTFLYNDGPVTSFDDPNLLFKQTYDLDRITYTNGVPNAPTKELTGKKVAPSNVGETSMPDYAALRREAVASGTSGALKSYVGQADDSFFLDLRVFDLLYGANLKEAGFDTLKNFNVNTIAFQVPKSDLAAAGNASANPVIGVWSTTDRYTTRTLATTDTAGAQSKGTGAFTQVSRLGNPLVNEAVVPAQLKDYFNRSTPANDGQFLDKVQDPELPYLIEKIYHIPNPNGKTATTPAKNRNDLNEVFLTGISKKAAAGTDYSGLASGSVSADLNSLDLNAVANGANAVAQAPAEYLRLNMAVPVTKSPNRLGVLGGDFQGFPNGRRLGDDVIDVALQALEGILVSDQAPAVKKGVGGLGDGVNANDKPFLSTFPYIADPWSGSAPHVGQKPITYRQFFVGQRGYIDAHISNLSQAQPGSFAELWSVQAGNKEVKVATIPLNTAGTGTAVYRVKYGAPTIANLFFKVFVNKGSAAGYNNGMVTQVQSR
jgi:hypothetical protein